MASIINRPNGDRWIQFRDRERKHRTIQLGKTTDDYCSRLRTLVEQLNAANKNETPIANDLALWLTTIDNALHRKLANVGLCRPRSATSLGVFITSYVASRKDVKPATKEVWRQGENGLLEYFGGDKPMPAITPGDADAYKIFLKTKLAGHGGHPRAARPAVRKPLPKAKPKQPPETRRLAAYTIRKRLQFATMIFRAAKRSRVIQENPFEGVSVKKPKMGEKQRFIAREQIERILDKCPNTHWKSIVALARYGGLRCPSEVLSLRWEDVDWERNRILVRSPKTEHHPGRESRLIPLFPELRPILADALEIAADGAVYVVDERMRLSSLCASGWRNTNLRTTFLKIVARAGLTVWPRPFHNLRASRQTELEQEFPSYVVCAWLGNSEEIAREHYLQITPDHFEMATAGGPGAICRKPIVKPSAPHSISHHDATSDIPAADGPDSPSKTLEITVPLYQADGVGFEHSRNSTGETAMSGGVQAKPKPATSDGDLAELSEHWDELPEATRRAIRAIVRDSRGRQGSEAGGNALRARPELEAVLRRDNIRGKSRGKKIG